MRKEDVKEASGVDKIFNIDIQTEYRHPQYEISSATEYIKGETGLLKVFVLSSKTRRSPHFVGRWDPRKEVLDVDILNVEEETMRNFRGGRKGLMGHHPDIIDTSNRTFSVHIKIDNEEFFKGKIFFNINYTLKLATGKFTVSGGTATMKVHRKGELPA